VYTSPLLRARQTAEPLCRLAGITPTIEAGLTEIAYGRWENMTPDEIRERFPEAFTYWAQDVAGRGAPGGETAFEVAARAMAVVDRIRMRHTEGDVLVVSHKATIRVIVCALLGMDVRLFRDRIGQPVAALSEFEMRTTGPMLVRSGDISHLPPDLQTAEGT
jgi:broad specificity phosphatase PhoE